MIKAKSIKSISIDDYSEIPRGVWLNIKKRNLNRKRKTKLTIIKTKSKNLKSSFFKRQSID